MRRVVTELDGEGRSVLASDGEPPLVEQRIPGSVVADVWATDATPVPAGAVDLLAPGRRLEREPPVGGTLFRLVRFEPGAEVVRHRTESIDYVTVVTGEITLGLDDGDLVLRAGDCLVQRGTPHSWHNRGAEPCVVSVVMIDALVS